MEGAGRRRIFLMRHGHVDYFAPDLSDPRNVPLTEEGRAQAEAARDAFRHTEIELAICSGLVRTRQTAEIVLSAHENAPRLQEHLGLEELKSSWIEAKSREELAARIAYSLDGAHEEGATFLPEGESFAAAQNRIVDAMREILTAGRWRSALVVAHEGVNRILLGWACGAGLRAIAAFEQDLACVNVIDFDITPNEEGDGLQIERAVIKAMNVTPYDYVKNGLARTSLEHLFNVDFGGSRPRNNPAAAQ